jgi:4-diphosphocytidyl-2-C-methyl-D-erythritol kinase
MKKVVINAPAKVNFTLDVLGVEDGYHKIKTLVSTINLCDKITIKKRKDSRINLIMKGIPVDCEPTENNAFKAAQAFVEKYKTLGFDIIVNKKIPVGAGLGGSSVDIAGVLNGLKALYPQTEVLDIANKLGSDSGYLLDGGYAVLTGRGEKVDKKDINEKFYLLIITEQKKVTSKESYKLFDKQEKAYKPSTASAEKALKEKDFYRFYLLLKNDLTNASASKVEEIKANLNSLKIAGASAQVMTGSGSAVFGVFASKKERDKAYKRLYPLYKNNLIKANTI